MKRNQAFAITLLLAILTMNNFAGSHAYALDVQPAMDRTTSVNWQVKHVSDTAFNMYFTGAGMCLVENESRLSFTVGEINEDIEGLLSIGNVSIMTNDTDVARDLVLGVGVFSPFLPGLFIKVNQTNLDELNASAYISAERISGNYMNGTMESTFDNVIINEIEYEAIEFDYEQDQPFAGDPQRTRLIYDITTGVLLYANTSYWFGEGSEPFWLEIEFIDIKYSGTFPPMIVYYVVILAVVLVVLISTAIRRRT